MVKHSTSRNVRTCGHNGSNRHLADSGPAPVPAAALSGEPTRGAVWRGLFALLSLAAVALPEVTRASPGDLDPAFGTNGVVVTTTVNSATAWAVVLQPDGRIVVAGGGYNFALVRYDTDGTLDGTFGSGGEVETAFTFDSEARALLASQTGSLWRPAGRRIRAAPLISR